MELSMALILFGSQRRRRYHYHRQDAEIRQERQG